MVLVLHTLNEIIPTNLLNIDVMTIEFKLQTSSWNSSEFLLLFQTFGRTQINLMNGLSNSIYRHFLFWYIHNEELNAIGLALNIDIPKQI